MLALLLGGLVITGSQNNISAIEEAYGKLPLIGKSSVVTVTPLIDAVCAANGTVGLYWLAADSIQVDPSLNRGDEEFTFAHEWGHHVYYAALGFHGRTAWFSWWEDHKCRMPRDYAATDAAEGFAECFAMRYIAPGPCSCFGYKQGCQLDPEAASEIDALTAP